MPVFDEDDWGQAPSQREHKKTEIGDGGYDVAITSAGGEENKAGDVYRFKFEILRAHESANKKYEGKTFDKTIFFDKKDGTDEEKREHRKKKMGELKIDLSTIGFDVNSWQGRLNKMIELASAAMEGCKVAVKVKNNGEFLNTYINKRLGEDGKPERFTDADLKSPAENQFGTSALSSPPASPPPPPAAPASPTPW